MSKDLLIIRTESGYLRDCVWMWVWGFACGAGLVLAVAALVVFL